MANYLTNIAAQTNKIDEENFNMILDESGGTDTSSYPKNRAIGALIFSEPIENLNLKFINFIEGNETLKNILSQKPHQLKYEKIKRWSKVNNIYEDAVFCLILTFLVDNGCKFYWHPIKSGSKNIQEENEKQLYGKKFTKIILEDNTSIIPNMILCKKREGTLIKSINIYCDEEVWKFDKFHVYLKGAEFRYYNQKIENYNYDNYYEFDIRRIKSTDLLHQCCDIISGIVRDNFDKITYRMPESYIILLQNKFTDIVDGEYT